jgi:hypothetical protein
MCERKAGVPSPKIGELQNDCHEKSHHWSDLRPGKQWPVVQGVVAADIKVDATSIKGLNTYTRVGRHICIVLKVYEKGKYQVPKLF